MAKIAFVMAMAAFLSRPRGELSDYRILLKGIGLAAAFFTDFAGAGPRFFVNDSPHGAGHDVCGWRTGEFCPKTHRGLCPRIVGLALAYVFFVPNDWKPIQLPTTQKRRLMVYFGVDYAKHYASPGATDAEIRRAHALQRQDSYNVAQAMITVGSGGLTGKGWKRESENTYGYLPRGVAHNDFIFSVIAEGKRIRGVHSLCCSTELIIVVGIRTTSRCRDRLGRIIATGVVTLLFCHVFVNIGMNIRIVPRHWTSIATA